MAKSRSPQDSTLRNVRAANAQIKLLKVRVKKTEAQLKQHASQLKNAFKCISELTRVR